MTVRSVSSLLFAVVLAGCAAATERPALVPVPLPDLAGSPEHVRTQLVAAHAVMTQTLDNRSASAVELAGAFGGVGTLMLAAEYVDVSEAALRNALALQPGDPRWPYYLGHLYWNQGQAAKAAASFEQALRLHPDDVPSLIWLGESRLVEGRVDDGVAVLTRALAADPQSAGAAFALGRAALAKKEYAEAIRRLEDARALDPLALAVHYPLSLAYRGVGNTAKADAHLRQRGDVRVRIPDPLMEAVDELIESVAAYEVRGKRAFSIGDWKGAAASFRRGVELSPDNPSVRHQLATALALDGDAHAAIGQLEEVVRRAPGFVPGRFSLGVLLESTGRRAEGVAQLAEAVRIDPDYADGHRRLAEVLANSGKVEDALQHFRQAIAIDPRVPDVRLDYAELLARHGRREDARRELGEGARLHPERPEFAAALSALPRGR